MDEYRLRKLDGSYVAVAVGETSKSFHGVLKLNDTAAEIFKMMQKGMTDEQIAQKLAKTYEISVEQGKSDAEKIRSAVKNMQTEQTTIEGILARDGVFISTTSGVSMYPLLKDRRDNVVIRLVHGRLKKYDVPLYRRGDDYVLHRIIGVERDSYVIIGDNCVCKEYGIKDTDIVGVAEGFYRRNHYVSADSFFYKCYSRIWVFIYPLRMLYKKIKGKLYSALARIKRVANKRK